MQPFDPERIRSSTTLLLQDLERQADDVSYQADQVIQVPGHGEVTIPILATRKDATQVAIALSGALTVDHPADPAIAKMRELWDGLPLVTVNELLVRGTLPAATRSVQAQQIESASSRDRVREYG